MGDDATTWELVGVMCASLTIGSFCAVFAWILIHRRDWVTRSLDAESAFWSRLGFRKESGFARRLRRFAESRFYTISMEVFAAIFFVLAAVCGVLLFLLRS